ncbi:unnamed protein product [Caenorhabditis brenneri]
MQAESTPSPSPMNSPGQSMKILDPEELYDQSRDYVDAVRKVCREDREKYDKFMQVMGAYRQKHINTRTLVIGLCEILHREVGLLLRFNHFLPEGHEFELKPEGFVYKRVGREPELIMEPPPPPTAAPEPSQQPEPEDDSSSDGFYDDD